MREEHEIKDGDILGCVNYKPGLKCKNTYKSFRALQNHISKNKCNWISAEVSEEQNAYNIGATGESVNNEVSHVINSHINLIKSFNLNHEITNKILSGLQNVIMATNQLNINHIEQYSNGCSCAGLVKAVNEFCCSKFVDESSRYKRDRIMHESEAFVSSQTIALDNEDKFEIIPISSSLETVFKHNIFAESYFKYNKEHKCVGNVYDDFCCASNFKKTQLFMDKKTIQIKLMIDEFELCDPLKHKTHKICGIYFSINNIPPKYRSRVEHIYLVALIKHEIVKQYGYNTIFRPIVDDLKLLEEQGIRTEYGILKGVLINILFDNAGGNALFGLPESFNADYCCRLCKITKKEMQSTFKENKKLLRSA